jgi:membrane protein
MKKIFFAGYRLISNSVKRYNVDDPLRLAGTTAFFTIFALAPVLIIILSVTGILLEEEAIRVKVFEELEKLIGQQGTSYIISLVSNYPDIQKSYIGTIVGVIIFIIASTTVFVVIQRSINYIWRIRAKPRYNFLKFLKDRLLSFGLILTLGFILMVSLFIDAGLSILKGYISQLMPDFTVFLIRVANFVFSFAITTLIFAMLYKFLPDAIIKWRVTWIGAVITAFLFIVGKTLIGLLLGKTDIGLMYGAAGSLVTILLWVFYSSMILYFGAEITQQYAEIYSHNIIPKEHAVAIHINEIKEEKK